MFLYCRYRKFTLILISVALEEPLHAVGARIELMRVVNFANRQQAHPSRDSMERFHALQ
jgi:hypothetical protein